MVQTRRNWDYLPQWYWRSTSKTDFDTLLHHYIPVTSAFVGIQRNVSANMLRLSFRHIVLYKSPAVYSTPSTCTCYSSLQSTTLRTRWSCAEISCLNKRNIKNIKASKSRSIHCTRSSLLAYTLITTPMIYFILKIFMYEHESSTASETLLIWICTMYG